MRFGAFYFYYRARYYDPKISVWLSVDPESARDPHMTPYHFVYNSPLMVVDPDGLHGYRITADGSIKQIDAAINPTEAAAGGTTSDVLYSEDLQRKSGMTITPGILGSAQEIPEGGGDVVQLIDFEDKKAEARATFEFVRDETIRNSTRIEYTISVGEAQGKDSQSYLTVTKGAVGYEKGYFYAVFRLAAYGYTNIKTSHFHPNGSAPSGFGINGDTVKDGDKVAYKSMIARLQGAGLTVVPKFYVDNVKSLWEYGDKNANKIR